MALMDFARSSSMIVDGCHITTTPQAWLLLSVPSREPTALAILISTQGNRSHSSKEGMVIIIIATIVIATIRDKCDIKLTTPFKFKTGRTDCIPTDPERPYASSQVLTMMRAIMMVIMIMIIMMMMMRRRRRRRRKRGRNDHHKIIPSLKTTRFCLEVPKRLWTSCTGIGQ